MRKNRWLFALLVLVLASLACSLVTGAKKSPTAEPSDSGGGAAEATEAPSATEASAEPTLASPSSGDQKYNTEFPLPADVSQFIDMGGGAINFQTGMKLKDALTFYREAFAKDGYKEREINTVVADTTFSLVFDGHASGKAIVIQAVDLGSGNININIRFEDI